MYFPHRFPKESKVQAAGRNRVTTRSCAACALIVLPDRAALNCAGECSAFGDHSQWKSAGGHRRSNTRARSGGTCGTAVAEEDTSVGIRQGSIMALILIISQHCSQPDCACRGLRAVNSHRSRWLSGTRRGN